MSTENTDTDSQNPSQETVQTQEQTSSPVEETQKPEVLPTETAETEKSGESTKTPKSPVSDNPLAVKPEKPEGEEKPEESKQEEKAQAEGAPENYEDFRAPEGIELNGAVVDSFKGVAKKLNLSQAKAQQVIDEITPVMAAQQIESVKKVSAQWLEASMKDTEIGGSNYDGAIQKALMVRDRFGKSGDGTYDPDIVDLFNLPIGSHPGFIKLLSRIGRAVGEDIPPKGRTSRAITPRDIYGI